MESLDQQGRTVVKTVYELFSERAKWPTFAVLDHRLDRTYGIDAQEALAAIPARYVRGNRPSIRLNDLDEVTLTLVSIAALHGSEADLDMLTRFVMWVAQREQEHDLETTGRRLVVSSEEAGEALGLGLSGDQAAARRLWYLVDLLPNIRSSSQWREEGASWELTISREVRRFRNLSGPEDLVARVEAYWRDIDAASSGQFPRTRATPSSIIGDRARRVVRGPSRASTPIPAQPDRVESAKTIQTSDAPSVFVSYAHEDADLVASLGAALQVRGCRVWVDQGEMRVGDRLMERIAVAIEAALTGHMVLSTLHTNDAPSTPVRLLNMGVPGYMIVSASSVKSSCCRRELSLAIAGELEKAHIKVLPVRIDSAKLPPSLKDIYSPRVDPFDIDGMANKLVADMASHAGKP